MVVINPRFKSQSIWSFKWGTALRLDRRAPTPLNRNIQNADYYYHKQIVDGFLEGLRAAGILLITEVNLVSVTGLRARADFMGVLPASGGIVMTEVKTSLALDDYDEFPSLPRFQAGVYRLVPMGGHVASPNAKVGILGLVPNQPFPPMRLHIIRAIPGMVYDMQDYAPGTVIPPGYCEGLLSSRHLAYNWNTSHGRSPSLDRRYEVRGTPSVRYC